MSVDSRVAERVARAAALLARAREQLGALAAEAPLAHALRAVDEARGDHANDTVLSIASGHALLCALLLGDAEAEPISALAFEACRVLIDAEELWDDARARAVDERELPVARFSAERCGAIAAELDFRPGHEGSVLGAHGLDRSTFERLGVYHARRIDEERSRGKREALALYDRGYVQGLERLRGPIKISLPPQVSLAHELIHGIHDRGTPC